MTGEEENAQPMEVDCEDILSVKALVETEMKYRFYFEYANDAIFTMDKDHFIECNRRTVEMFGCSHKDDIVGHHPWEFSPEVQPDGRRSLEKAKEKIDAAYAGVPQRFYWKHTKKDGTPFDAEVSLQVLEIGKNKRLMAIVRDVSNEKEAEERLHRLVAILENTTDFVAIATLDQHLIFLNRAGRGMLGIGPDEDISGIDISETHEKRAAVLVAEEGIPAAIREGVWRGETALCRRDGTSIPVSQVIMAHMDQTGGLKYLSTIMRDISREKEAEEKLRESEEFYRSLIELGTTVYAVMDAKGSPVYESESITKLYGYTPEEILGKPFFERIHPEDIPKVQAAFADLLKNPGEVRTLEVRYFHKDGSTRILEASGVNRIENPAIKGIIITSHDITERKEAESQINNFFELSTDFMFIIDAKTLVIKRYNSIVREKTGYTEEELKTQTGIDFTHPSYRSRHEEGIREAIEKGTKSYYYEDPYIKKDGSIIWLGITMNPDPNKEVFYAVGRDITDRKMAQQDILKRLMKFKLEFRNVYLVKETEERSSLEALTDLLQVGYTATIFSRNPNPRIRQSLMKGVGFHWLSGSGGPEALSPRIGDLKAIIKNLPLNEVLLVDRLDFIISKNGFSKTLEFVQDLTDLAHLKDLIVILSIDPGLLSESEMLALEKECTELTPIHEGQISEELFEIVKYVYRKVSENIDPTYPGLTKELKISRPTLRKRVHALINLGYVKEVSKGNKKVFELTEKGRNLFSV